MNYHLVENILTNSTSNNLTGCRITLPPNRPQAHVAPRQPLPQAILVFPFSPFTPSQPTAILPASLFSTHQQSLFWVLSHTNFSSQWPLTSVLWAPLPGPSMLWIKAFWALGILMLCPFPSHYGPTSAFDDSGGPSMQEVTRGKQGTLSSGRLGSVSVQLPLIQAANYVRGTF